MSLGSTAKADVDDELCVAVDGAARAAPINRPPAMT